MSRDPFPDREAGAVGQEPGAVPLEVGTAELAELAHEILGRGAALRLRCHGLSMSPFIRDGQVLTVAPAGAATIRLGDVILYRTAAGPLLAHRVLARGRGHRGPVLRVRGDASCGPCDEVAADQVLGRVVRAERGGRATRIDSLAPRVRALAWIALSTAAHRLANWLKRRAPAPPAAAG